MPAFSRDLEGTLSKAIAIAGETGLPPTTFPDSNDIATAEIAAVGTPLHCFIASREV